MTPDATNDTPDAESPRRSRLRKILRIAQWATNLFVLLVAIYALAPGPDRIGQALLSVDAPVSSDYILVLGGHNERAVEAARLYRQGLAPKVIVSSTDSRVEALAKVVEAYGVPRKDILLDHGPLTTHDHPRTVAALPEVDPETSTFLVVTSARHTSRARAVFVKAGWSNIRFRAPSWRLENDRLPQRRWLGRLTDMPGEVYELLAWGWYSIRGWV